MNLFYKLAFEILFQEVKLSFKEFFKFKLNNKIDNLNTKLKEFYLSCLMIFVLISICGFLNSFISYETIKIFYIISSGVIFLISLCSIFIIVAIITDTFMIFMRILFLEKIIQTKEFYEKQCNYFEELKYSLSVAQKVLSHNYNKTIIEFLMKRDFISKEEKDEIINSKEKWNSYELLEEIIQFIHQKNNKKSFKRDGNVLQQFKKILLCKLNIAHQILEVKNKKEFENKSYYEKIVSTIKDFYFIKKDEDCSFLFLILNILNFVNILTFSFYGGSGFIFICLTMVFSILLLDVKTNAIKKINITKKEIKKLNLNKEKDLNACFKYFEFYLNLEEKEKIVKDLLSLNEKAIENLKEANSTSHIEELRKLNVLYNDKLREIFKIVLLKNKTKSKLKNMEREDSEEEKLNNKIKELKKELTETNFVDEIKRL